MTARTIRLWFIVHQWTSLICTLFLLMLCVTGLPLIFHKEIDAATGHAVPLPKLAGAHPLLDLDAMRDRALANRPGEVPLYMSFDQNRPVVNITTGPRPDAPDRDMHFQSLDRRTGKALPRPQGGGVMNIVFQLHIDMLLGIRGMYFLGLMGLLFVAAIVSGVVLYAPFMRRLDFGTVRRERGARVRWIDLHNLLGIVTLAWALVVGLTGTINTLARPITEHWRANELAALVRPYAGQPVATGQGSVAAAVSTAMAAAPGMRPQFVAFPGVAYSSGHHIVVFLHGATPATKKLLTPALIDARSGRLDAIQAMPWYMQALSLSQPFHFGDYGGLPMKLLWAALDLITIVVLASGLYLWFGRRGAQPGRGAA